MKFLGKPFTFGLRIRLTLLIGSMIVILVLITGVITTIREKKALENELYKRGLALACDLAKFSASPLLNKDFPTLRRFVKHSMEQEYVLYAMVLDPQEKVIMHSNLAEVGKIFRNNAHSSAETLPAAAHLFTRLPEQTEQHCDLSAPVEVAGVTLGTVWLGYSCMAVEKEIDRAGRQIFLLGLFTIIAGGIAAYSLATFISAPIEQIIKATEAVASGNLNPSLDIRRNDEIGRLASSFNNMAEELDRHRCHLQNLVKERTIELETANSSLKQEIVERRHTQEELARSQQRLRELALHIQSVREEEAKRIAREIHDELGQALTALKMDLHWLRSGLSADQHRLSEKTVKMSKLTDMTIQSVRRISSDLRPGLLDDFGLSAAMDWQAKEFAERTGIRCDFVSEPENIVLDSDRSVAVFRIFQETLTNIMRHANATAVNAGLKETEIDISLKVSDNGRGITEKEFLDARSFGLIGMQERVNNLGGEMKIQGLQNQGTTVYVRIPKGET